MIVKPERTTMATIQNKHLILRKKEKPTHTGSNRTQAQTAVEDTGGGGGLNICTSEIAALDSVDAS